MILLISNDAFYLKNLNLLLKQSNIDTTLNSENKYFFKLQLIFDNQKISIKFENETFSFNLPVTFENLLFKIRDLLGKKYIKISNFSYNPVMQIISDKENECHLGNIHNIIFSNLVIDINKGIKKNELYNNIWPNDKDTQINKLETHITNLKNRVKKDISIDLKILSDGGFLKLVVN